MLISPHLQYLLEIAMGDEKQAKVLAAAINGLPVAIWSSGSPVLTQAAIINFFGSGVSVSSPSPGRVDVDITGGGGGGSVTAVTASSPLFSSGGTAPNITIQQATSAQAGYLSSADWSTFNGKQNALSFGNLTEAVSSVLTISGGTGVVIGSGTSIQVKQASGTQSGFLSSTDWSTFNSKQPAGSYITALTGDVVAAGPGSASATIQPLSVTNGKIANSTIDLTAKVTGVLPAANGGSPPTTRTLYVDNGRTDTYTADGSEGRPFKTIGAAVTQVITNADNSTHPYTILIFPGAYNETITLNSSTLFSLTFAAISGGAAVGQGTSIAGLTSTSNNTQLGTLIFNGIAINGAVNLSGDTNNTNFASIQVLFNNCQFNNGGSTITLFDINNVNFYNCQIQGTGSVATFTNVAFAYMEGAEGFISGTTLHLVQNNGLNQPSQTLGNYFLMSETKNYATTTIDAGSELDSLLSYFGSGSSITNNGTIHSWASNWNGSLTLNNGSVTRFQGDNLLNAPTINAGATVTNRGIAEMASANLGSTAVSATNAVLVTADGHHKSTQTTAPTTTPNANAGSGASSSVSHATDLAGSLSLTTGTASWASGIQTTVNFNKAYNVAPIVVLTPTNNNAANEAVSRGVFVSSTINGFSINFATADTAQTTYTWNYMVIETQ